MSGGAWEYMANYLGSFTENKFVSDFLKIEPKYQTPYAGTGSVDDRIKNYEANKEKYGDAIWETSSGLNAHSSWNGDCSYFPYGDYPFFLHGGLTLMVPVEVSFISAMIKVEVMIMIRSV